MAKLRETLEKFNITLEKAIVRAIAAYALVNLIMAAFSGNKDIMAISYFENVNIVIVALGIFAVFIMLCSVLIKSRSVYTDKLILFFSVSAYLLYAVSGNRLYTILDNMPDNTGVYNYIFVMLFEGVLAWYCFSGREREVGMPALAGKISYAVLGVALALFVGILTAVRYYSYYAPCFDFGIFAQMFHSMKTTGLPITTCERSRELTHFAVHISPIYYLILPFYMVFSSPATLQFAQAIVLASGVIPLYLLCRHYKLSETVTLAVGIAYVFYPALSAGCFYDIHENCFLTPLILWLLLSVEKDKDVGIFVSLLLTLFVKEDAAIYALFIGLYIMFAKKRYMKGLALSAISLAYFFFAILILNRFGDGAMFGRYFNFSSTGGSMADVFKAVIADPAFVFSQCLTEDKLVFSVLMLLPLGFLPLMNKKIANFILLGPFMLINLMSNYSYQHSLDFQYNFGVTALFFYLAVVNLSEFKPDKRKVAAYFCAVAAIGGFIFYNAYRVGYLRSYLNSKTVYEQMDEALDKIPEDASVYANTWLLPHVADRKIVYQLDANTENLQTGTQYYAFDLRYTEFSDSYVRYLAAGYRVFYENGYIGILLPPENAG